MRNIPLAGYAFFDFKFNSKKGTRGPVGFVLVR